MGKYQNQNKIHGNGGALFYPGGQRINDYEENFFSHTQTEVRVASRQGNSRGTKLTVPFSCSVLPVVAWCWQADSSVSWSDFEGEEREVSSQAKEKSPPSGPSWNSAVWSHEDTRRDTRIWVWRRSSQTLGRKWFGNMRVVIETVWRLLV
jgi:hypothetical protein